MHHGALFWQVLRRTAALDLGLMPPNSPRLLLAGDRRPDGRPSSAPDRACGYAVQLAAPCCSSPSPWPRPSAPRPSHRRLLFGCVRAFSQPPAAPWWRRWSDQHLANAVAWRSTGSRMAIIGRPPPRRPRLSSDGGV